MTPAQITHLQSVHDRITEHHRLMSEANDEFCRLAIEYLNDDPYLSVSDIARLVGKSQPTISLKLTRFAKRSRVKLKASPTREERREYAKGV
jgi:IS30 family transposase